MLCVFSIGIIINRTSNVLRRGWQQRRTPWKKVLKNHLKLLTRHEIYVLLMFRCLSSNFGTFKMSPSFKGRWRGANNFLQQKTQVWRFFNKY